MNTTQSLSQVHAHHYVAFIVKGFTVAFARMEDAYQYAQGKGAGEGAVQAVYRY